MREAPPAASPERDLGMIRTEVRTKAIDFRREVDASPLMDEIAKEYEALPRDEAGLASETAIDEYEMNAISKLDEAFGAKWREIEQAIPPDMKAIWGPLMNPHPGEYFIGKDAFKKWQAAHPDKVGN